MDPNTWYVSLPNGLPRISSPIILKRDTTTLTYLANKRSLQGLSPHMTRKIWKLHQLSFARRSTIIKLITGWNVDGTRYALYTSDPQAKATNSRCPLCLATDSDLKDSRDSILDTEIPNFLRDIQLLTQQNQPYLFPQLQDLCRALRTGLINSPHREPLWKGTWTSPLVNSLADTARANTRQNPWRSSRSTLSLLTKTLQGFGAITTTYVLNA